MTNSTKKFTLIPDQNWYGNVDMTFLKSVRNFCKDNFEEYFEDPYNAGLRDHELHQGVYDDWDDGIEDPDGWPVQIGPVIVFNEIETTMTKYGEITAPQALQIIDCLFKPRYDDNYGPGQIYDLDEMIDTGVCEAILYEFVTVIREEHKIKQVIIKSADELHVDKDTIDNYAPKIPFQIVIMMNEIGSFGFTGDYDADEFPHLERTRKIKIDWTGRLR